MATRPECTPGRIYVRRWVQLAVLPVLLIVAWFTLGAIAQVIFIFLVAGLVALVLNPLVHALERVHVNRYVGVFVVYVGFVAVLALVAVPPSGVAVFDSPLSALWVIITFVLIQEIEGHILVPVIMGSRFRVHPLVVIFAVLAGGEIHGISGMLIAIPLIPLVKETIVFLRPRMQLEGWCAAAAGRRSSL